MKHVIILATALLSLSVNARTIKIAVIDTGFDMTSEWTDASKHGLSKPVLCDSGHESFVEDSPSLEDSHGHGTHIAGIIASYMQDIDYCLVILKYFDPNSPGVNNLMDTISSFNKAIELNVDFINYSGGGLQSDAKERKATMDAFMNGITVVAAAGNEKKKIYLNEVEFDESGNVIKVFPSYFPAMYSTVISVGSTDDRGSRLPTSNHGTYVDLFFPGKDVVSILPNNKYGRMTGTSQAAARATGILVRERHKQLKRLENVDLSNIIKVIKREVSVCSTLEMYSKREWT